MSTIEELEKEIASLQAGLVGFDARLSAVERSVKASDAKFTARLDRNDLELKNQSRWLQEFSMKLSRFGTDCAAMQLVVNDMHHFICSKADELLRDYHDTIRASPPGDDDETDRAIKVPRDGG